MEEEPITTQNGKAGLLEQAELLMQEEKWQDVVNLLNQYRQNDGMSIEGLSTLAYCHSRNKDYKEASKIYEELCDRKPNEAKWFYHLAFQHRVLGPLGG